MTGAGSRPGWCAYRPAVGRVTSDCQLPSGAKEMNRSGPRLHLRGICVFVVGLPDEMDGPGQAFGRKSDGGATTEAQAYPRGACETS